jgi:peptidyl-prolyl cis-trans isomerase C
MTFRAIIALSLALLAVPVWAQAAPPAKADAASDPVVARINGAEVHRSEIVEIMQTLPPQARQQPPEKVYPMILDRVLGAMLVSQAGRKAKVQDDPVVKKRITLAEDEVIADAYMQRVIEKGMTDQKLHAQYDKDVKNAPPKEEVKARHILLANEEDAKAVIAQLKSGTDFAKLASEKTTDPSGKASGGDLGYFTHDEMVPEFADAAFKLKVGEFTDTPVKSQFGWHVIKVEDRRTAKPPTFEQMKVQLQREVSRDIIGEKMQELKTAAKIEVFNPDGSRPTAPAAAAAPGPAPGGPAPGGAVPGAPTLAPETAPDAAPIPTLSPATKPAE